jgi:enoyl-CoA hydratase/carnithine racemase
MLFSKETKQMTDYTGFKDIGVSLDRMVATVEIRRPPHNFFDSMLIAEIGEAFERLDADPACRALVLAAEGRSFCAGADFSKRMDTGTVAEAARSGAGRHLYKEAVRLIRTKKPVVGAIHGAAVGGGLGLALVPDFRVTCTEARFSANFNRLGFHPGFGLTVTLPRLVGAQQAALLFYTGRRIPGDEAVRIGLADVLVPQAEVRSAAQALALEIAQSAPQAVVSTRETMRRGLVDAIEAATERELVEQDWLRRTEDFQEGIKAMAERRLPNFQGR